MGRLRNGGRKKQALDPTDREVTDKKQVKIKNLPPPQEW